MTAAPQPRETLELFFHQVCDRQRLELLDGLLAAGFVFTVPPDHLERLDEVKAAFRRLFTAFPDLRFTVGSSVVVDGEVMVRWHAEGTHLGPYDSLPPTGRTLTYGGVGVLLLDREGRIARAWMASNLKEMVERLRLG